MPDVTPSLLRLIGEGFRDDEYAADGNHLRWMFHPSLGFPRFPFCLERRPSVATKRGQADVERLSANLRDIPDQQFLVIRGNVRVTRPDTFVGFGGHIPLAPQLPPVDIRFTGSAQPYAALARVAIQLTGNSHATVEAYHDSAGELRLVDRATTSFRPGVRFVRGLPLEVARARVEVTPVARRIKSLLHEPELGTAPPRTRERKLRRVYEFLIEQDEHRYRNVKTSYLRTLDRMITEGRFRIRDLIAHLPKTKIVQLDVFGDRIDFVRVSGKGGIVLSVEWVRADDLMDARWELVQCFSALTDEPDYVERNKAFLPDGLDLEAGVVDRLSAVVPNGAEPMDDPQVPPSRPPTIDERMARYGRPWLERLEPWLEKVLSDSFDGSLHQSEVSISAPLTEFGQKPGDGIPTLPSEIPGLADQTQTIQPYGMLLAASMAFPAARLMGLAAVDRPDDANIEMWDYRITGFWRATDIVAYALKLKRDVDKAKAALDAATPANLGAAVTELIRATNEFWSSISFIYLIAGSATGGIIRLSAYAGGLAMSKKPRFTAPAALDASFEELASPTGDALTSPRKVDRSITHLEWPLPARADQIERSVAMLATIARRPQGSSQPFSDVLNPADPDFDVLAGVVPLDHDPDDDGIATADFFDRNTESGEPYTYGVTQSDLFGRWSAFREHDYQWIYDIPPPPPLGVQAELDEVGNPPVQRLTVSFKWPIDMFPAADHEFSVFMARSPLTPAQVHDPTAWASHGLARTSGSGGGAFRFAGDFSGATSHDGMPVNVSFSDSTEADPAGFTKTYRTYRIRLRGVQLARVDELAKCWVGVQAHDASGIDGDEVAGPDRADHYDPNPPPPPPWPPDPLQASIADADGFSTFELSWSASPASTYEVFRVGERELISRLQLEGISVAAYDPDEAANFRAATLKSLALNAAARQAFARRSDLPPGASAFVDQLPGYASTLYLYVVLTRSPSGVPSPWPTTASSFLAVEVPRAPLPDTPVVMSARWEPADGPAPQPLGSGDRVVLHIAEPPEATADVAAYEVYRTRTPEKAGTTTTMRMLHRLDAPVFVGDTGEIASTRYIDPHIDPWTTYYYRVVARAPGTSNGAGMRSGASTVVKLTTLGTEPPAPPAITGTSRIAGQVVVQFTADAPTTPAGDFTFDLITRGGNHVERHTRARAAAARIGPDTYEMSFDDAAVPAGANVHVRVTDPRGRSTESPGDALPPP